MKVYTGINPCKGCTRREVHCHDKCVDYNKWRETGIQEPSKTPYKGKQIQKAKGRF